MLPGVSADPPSSILGGEDLLARIYTAVRASSTAGGSHFANTLFLVAFDEHGGNYDHVAAAPADPPDPAAPAGQMGFRFDRAGIRIPTLAVSAYIDPHTVITDAYRNTSLITTLRERWPLGPPLTARDATAPGIAPVLTRDHPPPAGGLARGHAPAGAPAGRPARPAGQAAPAAGPVPARCRHRAGHRLHRAHTRSRPQTATGRQANDYMNDRTARIYPGLVPHPS